MNRFFKPSFLAYTLATSVHFFHNAIFLGAYPNMPASISKGGIFVVLLLILAIGALGLIVLKKGNRKAGFVLVAIYAAIGFDGLAHYALAPVSAHSWSMNVTIWTEVVTAFLLFLSSLFLLGKARSR